MLYSWLQISPILIYIGNTLSGFEVLDLILTVDIVNNDNIVSPKALHLSFDDDQLMKLSY